MAWNTTISLSLMVAVAAACARSPTRVPAAAMLAGGGSPTLLVVNPLCGSGACRPLEVRAFVPDFRVPQPPWGLRIVGEIDGRTACLVFPASWTLRVIGPSDTTTLTWTPAHSVNLVAVDSAAFYGAFAGTGDIRGVTHAFVPGTAAGWNVTLSGSTTPTTAEPADPCR